MAEEIIVTAEGYEELKNELQELKNVKRAELAEKIKTARGFGDLSENSEYKAAKEEQSLVEEKILILEERLKLAKVLDKTSLDMDVVNIGSMVKLLDCEFDEEMEYRIVSSLEGNNDNSLTDKSPVGEALMGHRAGETVEVHAPKGVFQLKILEIRN